jgi:hypothetical protein
MRKFIERLGKVLEEVQTERGPIDFAALIEREETPGKYDLVISAEWITNEKPFYELIASKLSRSLTDADWQLYSRTVVLDPHGEFMQEFSRVIGSRARANDLTNVRIANINALYVHLFPTLSTNLEYA